MTATTATKTCPIKFTAGAIKEIKTLIYEKELSENFGLRIGVKGGGCSGFTYVLGFDELDESNDMQFQLDGFTVYLNKSHSMYLAGMEVDYLNGLKNRGFVFNNPNAKETCGCGESFDA